MRRLLDELQATLGVDPTWIPTFDLDRLRFGALGQPHLDRPGSHNLSVVGEVRDIVAVVIATTAQPGGPRR